MIPDVLIVGGGLAGCTLAWACRDRGATVRLIDRPNPTSASRVAAGLITPLTGQRLALSWRLADFYPAAHDFYRSVELRTGIAIFDANSTLRVFHTTAERDFAHTNADRFAPHLAPPAPPVEERHFRAPFGAVELSPAGRLDVPAFLQATRQWLGGNFETGDVNLAHPPAARWVVFCHGLAENPFWPTLRFRPTKGEVLRLRVPGVVECRTVNQNGTWLAPVGREHFLAGSTHDRADRTDAPTLAGREQILARIQGFLRVPPDLVGHQAGVRPILDASRPAIGVHPTIPGLAYFNGLGGKGALTAPTMAAQLAERMLLGHPIDPVVDVARFTKGAR